MEHNFTWKNDGRTKVMIGCGTRPEIIRLAAVIKRDYDDSHRAAAPLRQAEDAWLCDSTHLDFEGTVQAILAYIRQRIGEVPCR